VAKGNAMTYYYQGDWVSGKKLLATTEADTLAQADELFTKQIGLDPKKNGIAVTLEELTCV
jgi:hypothetical protein